MQLPVLSDSRMDHITVVPLVDFVRVELPLLEKCVNEWGDRGKKTEIDDAEQNVGHDIANRPGNCHPADIDWPDTRRRKNAEHADDHRQYPHHERRGPFSRAIDDAGFPANEATSQRESNQPDNGKLPELSRIRFPINFN